MANFSENIEFSSIPDYYTSLEIHGCFLEIQYPERNALIFVEAFKILLSCRDLSEDKVLDRNSLFQFFENILLRRKNLAKQL